MSRTSNITYRAVADYCHTLSAQGEKPSIRKLHHQLGGSFSTLSEFYQRWQEEQTLAGRVDTDLSEPFRQAVLAEFSRVSAAVRKKFEEQLTAEREQLMEAQGLLAEQESSLQQLRQEFSAYQKSAEENHFNLEKKLSSAEALTEEFSRREESLQKQLDTLRNRLHEVEVKAAVLEAQNIASEKQMLRLEEEVKVFRHQDSK